MVVFDELKATFWKAGASEAHALTDDKLDQAERILRVKLPEVLVDLLRIRDGGTVAANWNAFPTSQPTSWSDTHVPFDELMGIREAASGSLLDTPYLTDEWSLPTPIVLLSGDGHTWIALDYRKGTGSMEPSVTWFDTDSDTELHLASTFRSFVEHLVSASSIVGD